MLNLEDRLGSVKPGAIANLLVTTAGLFDEGTVIEDHWIQGQRFVLNRHHLDRSGRYQLSAGSAGDFLIKVSGKPGKHKASIPLADADTEQSEESAPDGEKKGEKDKETEVKIKFDREWVSLGFSPEKGAAAIRLSGWIEGDQWNGRGQLGDGSWINWRAKRLPDEEEGNSGSGDKDQGDKAKKNADDSAVGTVIYPFTAYGSATTASPQDMVFRNATVWTNEAEGIVSNTDVLVVDGKIAAVGQDLAAGDALEVDASGKHLTSGIIDEHSHIALSGVNDRATNSGMVRMSDVVNSEDVNIYRNLAGGVTAAQLLHGSANPIGGQSALIKMRWGSTADEMLIKDADGFIKFALGENVKRSRNPVSIRYPQTRMGVEQVYRDAFTAARDYQQEWADYEALSRRQKANTPAPRRDLVLDTMVEILEKERFITCHSYVQSEINMLMHVADDFGFNVNTFTHILEGYKVADKMAAHGVGGSTFSDWWAYKWEVRYAIPYNAALMSEAGVTVAINSDSGEMSRRLNQEAAKSVKYGGMSEEEAFKMVTLNPAKLLHLDQRMGSVKSGKDADLVLWSENPLSIYARAEKTLVDGTVYFDLAKDLEMREWIRAERARLVAKIGKQGGAKGKGSGNGRRPPRVWQCDSLTGYEYLSE
jgi:imidazolonepropionase-like amidohydrolase